MVVSARSLTGMPMVQSPCNGRELESLPTGGIPHTMHDMQVDRMPVIRSREL
jgi:hypothetical protein